MYIYKFVKIGKRIYFYFISLLSFVLFVELLIKRDRVLFLNYFIECKKLRYFNNRDKFFIFFL